MVVLGGKYHKSEGEGVLLYEYIKTLPYLAVFIDSLSS